MSAPSAQVAAMSGAAFFAAAAAIMAANPPHLTDTSMLQRARQLGFRPGEAFDLADAPRRLRDAVDNAPAAATGRDQGGRFPGPVCWSTTGRWSPRRSGRTAPTTSSAR